MPRGARRRMRTRTALLDAAEGLMAAKPHDAVRIDDIAEAADVSVGSVYVHFGSKDGIAVAVAERVAERATGYLTAAFDASTSPLEQVAAAGTAYMQFLLDNPVFVRYLATEPADGAAGAVEQVVSTRIEALRAAFQSRIEDAVHCGEAGPVDARLLAHFLFGAWNGVAALTLRRDAAALDRADAQACLQQARHIVVTGLAATTRTATDEGSP